MNWVRVMGTIGVGSPHYLEGVTQIHRESTIWSRGLRYAGVDWCSNDYLSVAVQIHGLGKVLCYIDIVVWLWIGLSFSHRSKECFPYLWTYNPICGEIMLIFECHDSTFGYQVGLSRCPHGLEVLLHTGPLPAESTWLHYGFILWCNWGRAGGVESKWKIAQLGKNLLCSQE